MKAGPIEIGRLLQNRQRFCVPIYQRHYVWTRDKQWEPFWSDIRTKAIECLAGRQRRFSHFMGAVVLEARGGFSAGKVPSFQVVDGQQRLTTFQLFLAAARDYALISGFARTAEKIKDYLLNDKPHLMVDADIEIYKVWPTQYDRPLFIDIIQGDRKSIRKKYGESFYASRDKVYEYSTVPRLLSAYGYFYDRIKHAVKSDDLDDELTPSPEPSNPDDAAVDQAGSPDELKLDAIWQALVEEFKVVEIVLEDGDDAQVIFETLNERGEPLLAADLVRNNIFQRADAAGEKAEQLFAKHWKSFEDPFWGVEEKQGRYKKSRIEFFLSNFIAGQIAGEVNLSKLFSEYKAFLKGPAKQTTPRYPTVAAELGDLVRFGTTYRELIERQTDSALAAFSRRLLPWDVTTVFPLVLRLWVSDLSGAEKDACLKVLLTFIVRRAVCGLTPKHYNKLFLSAVSDLDDKGWSVAGLTSFLLAQTAEAGRFPRDDEFERQWVSGRAYTRLQSARAGAVLREIEAAKRTSFHETIGLAASLSVEHIMPRDWVKNWPLPNGLVPTPQQTLDAAFATAEDDFPLGRIVRRNRLLHSFGNLTLLTAPLNASVSNAAFVDKRSALEEHSLLILNREVCKKLTWDEDAIEARGKALFSIARQVWPLPAMPAASNLAGVA